MPSTFLRAEWRKLVIANFSVDAAILKPYLPHGTEVDYWNDKCYVSLIGFRFINTKIKGIPIPFHSDFEEINLRFYVRHRDNGTWKRGVTFIKEIVAKSALTFVANSLYNEKYITLPTRHTWIDDSNYIKIIYEWKHNGAWDAISCTAAPAAYEIAAGSEEEFITEHYWGYTRLTHNSTSQYQVEHPRWRIYPVNDYEIKVRFGDLYGQEFNSLNDAQPDSVMLAEGSEVAIKLFNKFNGSQLAKK